MDYYSSNNQSNEGNTENTFQKNLSHYRATRLGITFLFVSVISFLFQTIIFPFIFAPLSIFFSYLAKGSRKKNDWYNNLNIWISILVLILNTVLCGYFAYSINHETPLHQKFDTVSQEVYGMPFNDYVQQVQNQLMNTGGGIQ